jgi:hypothetical protein
MCWQPFRRISAKRDLLNQLLGQAQMAEAFEISKTVLVSKAGLRQENKLYQQLGGKRAKRRS